MKGHTLPIAWLILPVTTYVTSTSYLITGRLRVPLPRHGSAPFAHPILEPQPPPCSISASLDAQSHYLGLPSLGQGLTSSLYLYAPSAAPRDRESQKCFATGLSALL